MLYFNFPYILMILLIIQINPDKYEMEKKSVVLFATEVFLLQNRFFTEIMDSIQAHRAKQYTISAGHNFLAKKL